MANCWIAVMEGMTVEAALAQFERAGIDVDTADALTLWGRQSMGPDDLPRLVRVRLVEATRGTLAWKARAPKVYPGKVDHVPPTSLVSGRQDAEAQAIRVHVRFRADKRSIDEIARDEALTAARVREILIAGGIDPDRKPVPKAARAATKHDQKAEDLADAEKRREALRKLYAICKRPIPRRLEHA